MKILVTGGADYLGSVLCDRFLDAGHSVLAVDSLLYGQNGPLHLCANPAFDFVFGDVRDERLLAELVRQPDVIVPLAALVGAPACDKNPDAARSVNLDAIKLLNRLRGHGQLI